MYEAGLHLLQLGRYSESLILFERARTVFNVLFGKETTKTIQAMHHIGWAFQSCGRLKEAQEIQEKVLEVRRRTLAADDPGTADAMHVLALTLYHPERMPEETILLMEEAACSYALYCSDLPKLWDTATA
jgi:tetratricopeptide (TPR) repeat protein